MFTAVDAESGEDIIILAPSWTPRLKELRRWGKHGRLICPQCRQPVRVRAGQDRRRHFAHHHKANCKYGEEDPLVVAARVLLYGWLVSKFGESAVAIEHRVEETDLPRPVDLWVSREKGNIAYWIFGKGVAPQIREALQKTFPSEHAQTSAAVNWVFIHEMLQADHHDPGTIHLTTTERDFLAASQYDIAARPLATAWPSTASRTLHYLNTTEQSLTTYRGLRLLHKPGTFTGHPVTHPLHDILVAPDNGEFIHPGEREQLQQLRAKQGQRGGDQTSSLAEAIGRIRGFREGPVQPDEESDVPSKGREDRRAEQDKIAAEHLERLRTDPEYRDEWFRNLGPKGKT